MSEQVRNTIEVGKTCDGVAKLNESNQDVSKAKDGSRGCTSSYFEMSTNEYIESQIKSAKAISGEENDNKLKECLESRIREALNLKDNEELPAIISSETILKLNTIPRGLDNNYETMNDPLEKQEFAMERHYAHVDAEPELKQLNKQVTGAEKLSYPTDADAKPITQNTISELMIGKDLKEPVLPEVEKPALSEEDIQKLHEEVDKYCPPEQLAEASFSELMASKRSFARTIDEMDKNYFQLMRIQQLKNLYPDNPLCKSMPDSFTADGNHKFNIDEFMNAYASDREKLVYSIELIDKALEKYEEDAKRASFLTQEMSNSLAKKIDIVEKAEDIDSVEKAKLIRKLKNSKAAYDDRVNLTYLKEKVNVDNPKFVKDVKKMLKNPNYDNLIANAIDILDGIFTADHINIVEEFLRENYLIWNGPAVIINYMARGLKSSVSTGNHIWYKLFFMNILDMCIAEHGSGVFDLEGGVKAAKKSLDEIIVQFEVIANEGREEK